MRIVSDEERSFSCGGVSGDDGSSSSDGSILPTLAVWLLSDVLAMIDQMTHAVAWSVFVLCVFVLQKNIYLLH
jgi:hypothetical protein